MSSYLLIVPLAAVLILNLPLAFLRKCVIPFGVAFALVQVPVQVIAHFVTFSRQAMDDIEGFDAFINSTLILIRP